jgi:hypothetical protein
MTPGSTFSWEGEAFVWNGEFYEARAARWRAKVWPMGDLYDVILVRPGGNSGEVGALNPVTGLEAAKAEWIKNNPDEVW